MMLDQLGKFLDPNGAPMSAVGGAGVTLQIGQIIDILGQGVGMPPANIIGNASTFGEDIGIGIWKLDLQVNLGVAFTTSNSATANFALQYANDTGASGGYLPGTFETASETGAKPASELVVNTVLRLAMPPTPPDMPNPRFVRMVMIVPAATNFTAGTVTGAFMVQGRDDLQNKFAASNYVVR